MVKLLAIVAGAALFSGAVSGTALAQEAGAVDIKKLDLPDLTGYASPKGDKLLAAGEGSILLSARLTGDSADLKAGLIWRIFGPRPGADGKLPLIATAQGGTSEFALEPGSYLVHAAFGRAGATKKITVNKETHEENLVLDAGGLKLDAVLRDGSRIAAGKLRFSIYDGRENDNGSRALILPNVPANSIIRLNAGTYHVISNYGDGGNASIRADIAVEAGKLTEAVMEHSAAEVTLKLVREAGGEALADTSWAVLTGSGDVVRDSVGAYAMMVLAEGAYTVVAKNRDQLYQREFVVTSGQNQDVEVITAANAQPSDPAVPETGRDE